MAMRSSKRSWTRTKIPHICNKNNGCHSYRPSEEQKYIEESEEHKQRIGNKKYKHPIPPEDKLPLDIWEK